ncbi:type II toxin-antitoxin system RelE/ParE family toxin [Neorhizobium sp. NCHU2750]|uniref:type II toxin-antitoxin system RelE/ParE family toxin n=1 Tax=Neorhizobium sp. NCHU2750 TaxID=1825976 RepID=UPI000E753FCD|nr:plasmid stabilization protein [Neorhizobium sp. NCHU2750]
MDRIWSYIDQDNPDRAITFIREIGKRCQQLKDMPLRYQLLAGHEETGIRRIPHGKYVICYIATETAVFILHILSAAQDHGPILFPDDPA